jgi:hypothetical protein
VESALLHVAVPLALVLACHAFPFAARAATLKPATVQAWDRYYLWADAKVSREVKDPQAFLIQDHLPSKDKEEVLRALQSGKTYINRVNGVIPTNEKFSVPDGEIHHWWGTVLAPQVKLADLLIFLKDYNHHAGKFSDVISSRLLSQEGDHFTVFFGLMRAKSFVTAYYHTVQEAFYYPIDSKHAWSKSLATRIAELENPGTPKEKELPMGEDRGLLWRLASWWRFQETDHGVVVEIESASLSRDIPVFVRFIPGVSSYIRSTPKESMESVLLSIRAHFVTPK